MHKSKRAFLFVIPALAAGLGLIAIRAKSQSTTGPVCLVGDLIYSEGAQVQVKGGKVRCHGGIWMSQ
jgi:hypothetical protein